MINWQKINWEKQDSKCVARYSAMEVAKYVLNRSSRNEDLLMSNLKLQKILYFLQAEFLVTLHKPCFSEDIVAWDFGPVVREVYEKYAVYGAGVIPVIRVDPYCPFTDVGKAVADVLIAKLGPYANPILTDIVQHQTPWVEAYEMGAGTVISKESLCEFFRDS